MIVSINIDRKYVRNSFFLVIPAQQKNPDRRKLFEELALEQWIDELPTANPGLATRLLYDLIEECNGLQMDVQLRLDALEMLRPSYQIIEEYLRFRMMKSGFPKGANEQKIYDVLLSLEKEFAIGYWMVVRELTKRDIGWFQGKNTALAIQRVIKGLSNIVITHYVMSLPVPDWVWMDLHSLYKLGVKLKKEQTKVPDETNLIHKSSTIADSYRQILLLSLANPMGLMQKEIHHVYLFTERLANLLSLETKKIPHQKNQCLILTDEDKTAFFHKGSVDNFDSAIIYVDFSKIMKAFSLKDKFISHNKSRFSLINVSATNHASDTLPEELINYLQERWEDNTLIGSKSFSDRLDRQFSIGLDSTYNLQNANKTETETDPEFENNLEYLAESASPTALSCLFDIFGVLSIGSLVSYRKVNEAEHLRALGVVKKIFVNKPDGKVNFEINSIATQSHSIEFKKLDKDDDTLQKGLIYGAKEAKEEKSYLIMESFMIKDNDVIRLFMNDENFPIILTGRKNIGLGYWQFECRRIAEREDVDTTIKTSITKGYDFI